MLGRDVDVESRETFIELGGDSIDVVKMVQEIERQMGLKVSVAEAYESLTIDGLSALLERLSLLPERHCDPSDTPLLPTTGISMPVPGHLRSLLLQCMLSEEASVAYNLVHVIPIANPVDRSLLLYAWNLMLLSQTGLRLAFSTDDEGDLVMGVLPFEPLERLPEQVCGSQEEL